MKPPEVTVPLMKLLRPHLEKAVQEVLDKNAPGLAVKFERMTCDRAGTRFTASFDVAQVAEGGNVMTKAAEEFKACAHFYSLKPEQLFQEFKFRGEAYIITGLNTRSTKMPLLAKRVADGKEYKMSAAAAGGKNV